MSNMTGTIVTLRPVRMEDASILNTWKNDESTYRYLGGGYQPVSIDQYRKWVENMIDQTGNARRFMIETSDHQAIGMVGLYSINWIHRTCEIGIFLGEHRSRGKGAATEACQLLERYAASYLNLRKITLNIVDDNEAAKALWYKLDYQMVGRLSKERYINGKYCDVLIMEKFLLPDQV